MITTGVGEFGVIPCQPVQIKLAGGFLSGFLSQPVVSGGSI
jgi:hypothetical protein